MPKPTKYVYCFGQGRSERVARATELLGRKGATLAEMSKIGLPVPPGFVIAAQCYIDLLRSGGTSSASLEAQVHRGLARIASIVGKAFGDPTHPLLLSCRSSPRHSMPGMMETILNIGLTSRTLPALAAMTGNPRFAWDSYRRLLQMYADVVMEKAEGIEPPEGMGIRQQMERELDRIKHTKGYKGDTDLSVDDLKALVAGYHALIDKTFGKSFPDDPMTQLWGSIRAVFRSWIGKRATAYRRIEAIPDDWGTAAIVQAMVFGNMGHDSATGVLFTRDPSTGERRVYGEWLANAQGEDVVSGIRTPEPLDRLAQVDRNSYRCLIAAVKKLEHHYRDMSDVEFTIERGQLYVLQARVGKRTGPAAVRLAVDMVREGLIDIETALLRVSPSQLEEYLRPRLDPSAEGVSKVLTRGLPAGSGAAVGRIVFSAPEAVELSRRGERVILVARETQPEDVEGIRWAEGVLTVRGGMTSGAALLARAWGKCCVVGAGDLEIDSASKELRIAGTTLRQGDWISLNGTRGTVYTGQLPLVAGAEDDPYFKDLLLWSDTLRRLGVRANADTPEDAAKGRAFGAAGIGLLRTEHMFYGRDTEEPLFKLRKMIHARTTEERKAALDELFPHVKNDLKATLATMDGLPVTIRLLDPPLHEFLPYGGEELSRLAENLGVSLDELNKRADALHEVNPMMGHRGVRLGITHPEVSEMQVRAILEAVAELSNEGRRVLPQIMVAVTCDANEVKNQRKLVDRVHREVAKKFRMKHVPFRFGTMIEIPRAALKAGEIAEAAEFFSFGTNDLTQFIFGFSRDDVGGFLPEYVRNSILPADPFQHLDQSGVGELVKIAIERGRRARPDLEIGICGEHGGDAESVQFCHCVGMDYVSCSPYRVPIARLAAAQAAIRFPSHGHSRPGLRRRRPRGHQGSMRPQSTMRQHGLSADADDIIWDLALSPKGDLVACASSDGEVRLMRTATGQLARRIPIGSPINSVAFSPTTGDLAIASGDGLLVVAGSDGTEQRTVARLRESVESVAWTPDGQRLAYCMGTPRLVVRALDGKQPAMELPGHRGPIRQVTMLTRRRAVTCSSDLAIRTWDVFSGDCLATLLGHTQAVNALAIRYPQGHIISGSDDLTVRIWDPDLAQCICVLEDHKAPIWDVSCSPDGIWAASASEDRTVRLWNLQAEQLVHVFEFRTPVYSVLFTKDGSRLCVASEEGLSLHDLAKLRQRLPPKPRGVRYSSAKMVLCGDTGVGKSSLADRLIRNRYICHESTHGLRILPLPQLSNSSRTVEREVWLWDLAGQSEYRLIHQLFLDYTSLAMVLFDPHDPASLNQLPEWEKRLKLAVRSDPEKILVAAKMDLDGQCLSPHTIDDYRRLHGYLGFVSTSAKTGLGRTRLLNMLRRAIPWRRITPTTTHATFRCLRDAVLKLRTGETAVLDFKTLAAGIRRVGRTPGPADQDIRYVLTLLSNENVVRQLDYGSLVLLRPELLNAYASSLIHAATSFAGEIGGLDVADVITGKFPVKRMRRLPPHEERVLLPAVVQLLESRSLCLRMTLSDGRDRLIFPSQCTRKWERKPAHHILLRYGFAGQVSNFFVTLAVRLIYSGLCEAWQLFENAISVTTGSKNIVDVVVTGTADGDGEVQVFHRVPVDESSVARVCGFVQEHVDQMVGSLERTRYFRCGACGTLWGNNTDADAILRDNHTVVQCNGCGRELVLLDALEQMCRGKELDDLLREARERVSIRIDSQSKEWVMVGEVMAVVAQADQVFQPYSNTYYAIDGHIEFKNEASRLSGRRVLVQLKHGDSYTYHRERDGKDVFYVKDPGHAIYWRDSDQPVFLVIRSSRGDTQWMNVTEYIRNHPTDGLKRIEFEGTPLTPLAILRLRDMLLENT